MVVVADDGAGGRAVKGRATPAAFEGPRGGMGDGDSESEPYLVAIPVPDDGVVVLPGCVRERGPPELVKGLTYSLFSMGDGLSAVEGG